MIKKIKKYDLCIGCGLCEAVIGKEVCTMELNNKGFYEPIVNEELNKKDSKLLKYVCPGIHVETTPNKGAWGSMKSICEAWATDKAIRHKAASGVVVTSLAIFLLEHHAVDAILQVGVKAGSYLHNELKVSRTKDDILANAQSRYAPALVFSNIKRLLESSSDTYAFIGKPCDIAGIKNYLSLFPQYKDRIKFFISIFCAGMPSYNATERTWKQSGHTDEPIFLKYRGEGWPGNFCCPTYKPTAFVCHAATAVSSTHNRSGKNHPGIRRSTEKPEEGIARRQAEIFCFLSWEREITARCSAVWKSCRFRPAE